jgi:uncharacterized protein YdhG (YjbR/CyaY superfamily)
MARTGPSPSSQINAYLRAQPPVARHALKQIRAIVRATVPGATDAFSYRMPACRLDGRILIYYAAFTNHFSIFPVGPRLITSLGKAAERYETSNKGTIRFPLDAPVPIAIIKKIVKARVAELPQRGK